MFFSNLYEKDVDFPLDVSYPEWEPKEAKQGVRYYVNHRERSTQWDHPHYGNLQKMLATCDNIKYAAYRTAKKINILQSALLWKEVHLDCVVASLSQNGLMGRQPEVRLDCAELLQLLNSILQSSAQTRANRPAAKQLALAAELTLNLFLNVYNKKHRKQVNLNEVKAFTVVMTGSGRLQDKLRFLFSQACDHDLRLSPKALNSVLTHVARLPDHLSEGLSFGTPLLSAAIRSCFDHTKAHSRLQSDSTGLTEDAFIRWMLCEPQLIAWWSTLYRMQAAAHVLHEASCGSCGAHPIQGLRYQCLRCLRLDLCQSCFLTGELGVTRGHKNTHPVLEHCIQSGASTTLRAVIKLLWHWVRGAKGRKGQQKRRFLPLEPNIGAGQLSVLVEEDEDEDEEEGNNYGELPPAEEWPSRTLLLDQEEQVEQWMDLEGVLRRLQDEMGLLESHVRGIKAPLPVGLKTQLQNLQKVIQGLQDDSPDNSSAAKEFPGSGSHQDQSKSSQESDAEIDSLSQALQDAFPTSVETKVTPDPFLLLVDQLGDHLESWLADVQTEKL